jgi:hypothetical protein
MYSSFVGSKGEGSPRRKGKSTGPVLHMTKKELAAKIDMLPDLDLN